LYLIMDRVITWTSYAYVTLPVLLFAGGWLKWHYAMLLILIVAVSLWQCACDYNAYEQFRGFDGTTRRKCIFFLGIVFVVAIWVGFSGIGGFSFQNSDHELRNLMFHDLIDFDWPVIYDHFYESGSGDQVYFHGALVYYIAYWLPAAVVGKLWGWQAANIALYCWTVLGIALCLYHFLRYLRTLSWIALLIFIFWSGMDAVGVYLFQGNVPLDGQHLEWWMKIFQYSSNTTLLFWVFNQTVTSWLLVLLILNQRSIRNLLFTYSLCMPFAPYPFIGLAPFVIYKFCKGEMNGEVKGTWLSFTWANIRKGVTFANIIGAPVICLVVGMYFLSNPINTGNSGSIWSVKDLGFDIFLFLYSVFCILEFGLYAEIARTKFAKNPYFLISVIILSLIPFYEGGINNDFAMRASIPALLVLMIFVVRYLLEAENGWRKYVLIFFLVIGTITPLNEIIRSVKNTVLAPENMIQDHLKTFAEPKNIAETTFFVAQHPERSFFFKYLAKKQ